MKPLFIQPALALLFAFLGLPNTAFASSDLTTLIERQGTMPYPKSLTYCTANSGVKVVDTSETLTPKFIKRMKSFGVEVVARYYGYDTQSRPPNGENVPRWEDQKVITKEEVELLEEAGLGSIAVFQYESDLESVFRDWKRRGPADARRSLSLAKKLGQPRRSTIYFAVDGDFVNSFTKRSCKQRGRRRGNCAAEITSYFDEVSRQVREDGYRVGVYGSGATCKLLTERGSVDMCWLNFSNGHSGRKWGLQSEHVVLRQLREAKGKTAKARCGRNLDANKIRKSDFGQFRYAPPPSPQASVY